MLSRKTRVGYFATSQYASPQSKLFQEIISSKNLILSKRFEAYKERRVEHHDFFFLGMERKLNGFKLVNFLFEKELARKIDSAELCEAEGIGLYCLFNPSKILSGHPGVVHGGCISGIYDEAVANLSEIASNLECTATKYLNVTLHKPVFVGKEYLISAFVEKIEGRKVFVSAKMIDELDNVCSESKSLHIRNVHWAENLWFAKEEEKI